MRAAETLTKPARHAMLACITRVTYVEVASVKDLMVASIPVFDKYKEVQGYYLSYQIGNALIEGGKSYSLENSTESPFFDLMNEIGLDALTGGKLIFLPVTGVFLATDFEKDCQVDPASVVLLLNAQDHLSHKLLHRLAQVRERGFKVALKKYADLDSIKPILPHTDFVFCGNETEDIMPLIGAIKKAFSSAKVIVSGVNSNRKFDQLSAFNVELFEGQFYRESIVQKEHRVSPLKINYLQLLNQVNQEDFELDKFAGIVQRDTALALQFLRMVNSSSVRSSAITSRRHAAALLGQKEIKKWVTTAVTTSLAQESPGEITRLSMLRAKFCENLAGLFEMAIHKDNLFLMGLFSVLDVVLETSMERALGMVVVPENVKKALLNEGNDFGVVYNFVKAYELGDWTEISLAALTGKLEISAIAAAYREALAWYGHMISMQIDEGDIDMDED